MELLAYIVLILILYIGVKFVNQTKGIHKTCCGRGCRGCQVFEDEREKRLKKK